MLSTAVIPRTRSESNFDRTCVSNYATDFVSDDISEPADASYANVVCEILITHLEISGIVALDHRRNIFMISCLDVS